MHYLWGPYYFIANDALFLVLLTVYGVEALVKVLRPGSQA